MSRQAYDSYSGFVVMFPDLLKSYRQSQSCQLVHTITTLSTSDQVCCFLGLFRLEIVHLLAAIPHYSCFLLSSTPY